MAARVGPATSGRTRWLAMTGNGSLRAVLVALFGLLLFGLLTLFRQPFHRGDLLALCGREHDDALRGAAGDADAVDRAADQLPTIGDQHDLVGFLDRK